MKSAFKITALAMTLIAASPLYANTDSERGTVTAGGRYISAEMLKAQNEKTDSLKVLADFKKSMGFTVVDTDLYKIENVFFNTKERWIEFPAQIEKTEPTIPIEYVVGTFSEKAHESIFTTDVKASNIHLAALLLNINAISWEPTEKSRANIPSENQVIVEVRFKRFRGLEVYNVNDYIGVDSTGNMPGTVDENGEPVPPNATPLARHTWVYNGSQFVGRFFAAQHEGGYISVMCDPAALVNYGGDLGTEMTRFYCLKRNLPNIGHPVTIRIRFLNSPAS